MATPRKRRKTTSTTNRSTASSSQAARSRRKEYLPPYAINKGGTSLLDLPGELRNKIYDYLGYDGLRTVQRSVNTRSGFRSQRIAFKQHSPFEPCLIPLARVCRLLRHEVISLHYQSHDIRFRPSVPDLPKALGAETDNGLPWTQPICDAEKMGALKNAVGVEMKYIRHIEYWLKDCEACSHNKDLAPLLQLRQNAHISSFFPQCNLIPLLHLMLTYPDCQIFPRSRYPFIMTEGRPSTIEWQMTCLINLPSVRLPKEIDWWHFVQWLRSSQWNSLILKGRVTSMRFGGWMTQTLKESPPGGRELHRRMIYCLHPIKIDLSLAFAAHLYPRGSWKDFVEGHRMEKDYELHFSGKGFSLMVRRVD